MSARAAAGALALAALAFGAAQAQETVPAQGETAAELAVGKASYAQWCAPCHAAEPGLAGTLALQTKYEGRVPAALEDRTDLTPEVVAVFVRNGVAWMPPFRKTEISDAELASIGAYLSAPLEQRGPHAELLADEMFRKHGGRPMITRRDLIKWGVVAPALMGGAHTAFAKVPEGLDALVLDRRHVGKDLAGFSASKIYRFDGDVTALWYETLDPIWRKPGFVLGGVTGRDALFVLETLAADRGRRVVSRRHLPPAEGKAEGPLAWVIAPIHPSVRRG